MSSSSPHITLSRVVFTSRILKFYNPLGFDFTLPSENEFCDAVVITFVEQNLWSLATVSSSLNEPLTDPQINLLPHLLFTSLRNLPDSTLLFTRIMYGDDQTSFTSLEEFENLLNTPHLREKFRVHPIWVSALQKYHQARDYSDEATKNLQSIQQKYENDTQIIARSRRVVVHSLQRAKSVVMKTGRDVYLQKAVSCLERLNWCRPDDNHKHFFSTPQIANLLINALSFAVSSNLVSPRTVRGIFDAMSSITSESDVGGRLFLQNPQFPALIISALEKVRNEKDPENAGAATYSILRAIIFVTNNNDECGGAKILRENEELMKAVKNAIVLVKAARPPTADLKSTSILTFMKMRQDDLKTLETRLQINNGTTCVIC